MAIVHALGELDGVAFFFRPNDRTFGFFLTATVSMKLDPGVVGVARSQACLDRILAALGPAAAQEVVELERHVCHQSMSIATTMAGCPGQIDP